MARSSMLVPASIFAAVFGVFLVIFPVRGISLDSMMVGAVLSAWLATGVFALAKGTLCMQGRQGPVNHYTGRTARLIGAAILVLGVAAGIGMIRSL